jgi:hypothetical protein
MNKKQENEFNRLVNILVSQGDVDVLTNLIPNEIKINFINEWHDDDEKV